MLLHFCKRYNSNNTSSLEKTTTTGIDFGMIMQSWDRKVLENESNADGIRETLRSQNPNEEIQVIMKPSKPMFLFSGACVWRSIPKRPMMLGREGNKINEKGGGQAATQGKAQPSPIWTNNKCGTMRKAKISRCLLAHHWQKRTRTPFTGRRLSSSGSRSGVSSSSSTQPLRLWPILSFSNDCCLGGYIVGSVVSDSSGFTLRANLNERDASSEQRREKHG